MKVWNSENGIFEHYYPLYLVIKSYAKENNKLPKNLVLKVSLLMIDRVGIYRRIIDDKMALKNR